ncbi:uncharacterized protein LOC107761180 [Nicotiana tabacum]|uniref:Uncharacterized protein LOC107761180 n=1 Tax=Nicotiana tabacum TaxID=4097 RepID=A0AC58SIS1_TOBAC
MTFVYAKCSPLERLELWENLYYLTSNMKIPWVVGGDFNVLMDEDEKIGGIPVYPPEYEDFACYANSCALFDVGYKGSPFTWWNGRPNSECIFKRPDRIFANQHFQQLYPRIEVEHLIRTIKHDTFLDVVRQNWLADFMGDHFLIFKLKLKRVKTALSHWCMLTYGDIFKQLAIREDIVRVKEILFEEDPTIENRIVLQKAQAELKKYLSFEEQFWKQKEGMTWFDEDDRNTRFFHNYINGKRQKLQLKRIQNLDGAWLESQELMSLAAVEFFRRQFTQESNPTNFDILNNIPAMVTMERNMKLCRFPSFEEVKHAVFTLSGDSASGPDGFTGLFYQHCWEIVGEDIFNMVERRGKPANIVIKLDMANAYDRVSWQYVLHVLGRMGFAEHYIIMIWNLLANNWGVKQGDPLSPALFILSAEVLTRTTNKLFDDKKFIGYGMPKWVDPLNHLAYADDTIIFSSADTYSLGKIVKVLTQYEQTSRQLINKS